LKEAGSKFPGWPLLITGHSMGGGTAALLTLILEQDAITATRPPKSTATGTDSNGTGTNVSELKIEEAPYEEPVGQGPHGLGPVTCITFGSAAVMSDSFAEVASNSVTSVVVGSDVIPHLSAASVEKLFIEMAEASTVRTTINKAVDDLRRVFSRVFSASSSALGTIALSPSSTGKSIGGNSTVGSWKALKRAADSATKDSELGLASVLTPAEAPIIPIIDLNSEEDPEEQLRRQTASSALHSHPVGDREQEENSNGDELDDDVAGWEESWKALTRQEQQQQGEVEEESHLVSVIMTGSDAPGITSAVLATAAAEEQQQQQQSNNNSNYCTEGPETLYPPGRILWIFPPDEEIDTNGNDTDYGGGGTTRNKNTNEGGAVNMKGASDTVVDKEQQGSTDNTRSSSKSTPKVCIVAEADRRSFEKILLLQEMVNDHLPDRYLEALQQL
jgi:hypothetical protein